MAAPPAKAPPAAKKPPRKLTPEEWRQVGNRNEVNVPDFILEEATRMRNAKKAGGPIKKYAKGGGIESKGKTRCKIV